MYLVYLFIFFYIFNLDIIHKTVNNFNFSYGYFICVSKKVFEKGT